MRITSQLIRQQATGPLPSLEYLDLSSLDIDCIERLASYKKLQYINLQGNNIQDIYNLECCPQLWSLNLSCNQIQCLDGLSRFLCFGTLILSNNDLSWKELVKIRHIHILNLSLHGNPQLEKDNYYRIHVIDCLPNVWMLDGRIITSAERIQVKNFFQDSALTEHPVRRKLTRDWFVPSTMKHIELTGLFGQKATSLLTKFPVNAVHNIEMDRKRLQYLAYNLQEDLVIEQKATKSKYQYVKYKKTFLEDLLSVRCEEREKCNMLLLLLVASLEFILPTHLVQETLETTRLQKMGKVYCMDIFLLPRDVRCKVVSILLSAVKIDKDDKENGGLYDKLYLCLFFIVSELTHISQTSIECNQKPPKYQTLYYEYKCLLAAEVVQLLCIVPALFDYIEGDVGVMNLISMATRDKKINQTLSQILETSSLQMKSDNQVFEEISDFILKKIQEQMMNMSNKTSPTYTQADIIINKMKALPMKRINTPLHRAEYHAKGVSSPEHLKSRTDPKSPVPQLGDLILLGPQTFGKIINLPQPNIVLVSIDAVPVSNGAMVCKLKESDDHYTYINMKYLTWEPANCIWKPIDTVGDRFTLQSVDNFQQELERKSSQSDLSLRPNSPDDGIILGQKGSYRTTEPLIFTPRQNTTRFTGSAHKPITKTPRPMSSVLKEKLDLKLDMSKNRAKSARATRRSQSPSQTFRSESIQNVKTTNGIQDSQPDETVYINAEVMVKSNINECIDQVVVENNIAVNDTTDRQQKVNNEETEQHVCSNRVDDNSQDKQARPKSSKSDIYDRRQNSPIMALSKPRPCTAKPNLVTTKPPALPKAPEIKTPTYIEVQIPQFEIEESERNISIELDSHRKQTRPVKKQPDLNNYMYKPKISQSKRNRPFSAVEAYKTFINQQPGSNSRNQPSSGYMSDFQKARTDAWKLAPKNMVSVVDKITPPPQRPSSPASKDKSKFNSGIHVTKANNWLGGGRDLHKEMTKTRPKSGHTPGWKDGLPDSLKRPKSAVSGGTHAGRTSLMDQSSMMYSSMSYGGLNDDISEIPNHFTYTSLQQQLGLPRQFGSSTDSSHYLLPHQDIIYR
ncbi:uncharacterized protein LOC126818166 isoform X2 [Patella vulgata]|uniref:uncharacterized protein LOC126818166 isoform X2 n=1 Tax=Patella vulgata TaxID=6465 RepID=UPI00217FF5CD|nr:uncharacterized protein LOC126818166 isoform X2 [Patella vulgata]